MCNQFMAMAVHHNSDWYNKKFEPIHITNYVYN